MSNVTLTIGGRPYTVACAAGEERHIENLGRSIDAKLGQVPGLAGQSEARTLLFAALLLADELHELNQAGQAAPAPLPSTAATDDDRQAAAEALEIVADRLESLADRLETGLPSA
jgi:cell division protein ZapA